MKRIITSIMLFFFIGIEMYGQAPTWSVNENNFEYTMSFVAFLNIEGATLSSTNDKVAAFVNGECRGVTNLIYVSSKDRYYAYFNVFSNISGKALSFKVYDSTHDKVVDINKTVNFEINALYGNLSQAFSFANPALNSEAELKNFSFKDVPITSRSTDGSAMTLYVENGQSLAVLTPIFELSPGAQLLTNGAMLTSDSDALNFSSTVIVEVLSQDESSRNQWEITVKNSAEIGNLAFYKKDAVCYNGGAIKVASSENGVQAVLLKDNEIQSSQELVDGEAVFINLETGDYVVKVDGFEKNITINLKE